MTCARCDGLARQLAEARDELAEWRRQGQALEARSEKDSRVEGEHRAARISRGVARMLLMLIDASPRVMSREALFAGMPHKGEGLAELKVIDVHVARLRGAMAVAGLPKSVIKTAWGLGYFIDRTDARQVMEWAGLEVAEAS